MEMPFNVVDVSVRVVIMFRKNDFDGLPDYTVVIRDTCEYDVDDEINKMRDGGWEVYVDSQESCLSATVDVQSPSKSGIS